MALGIDYNNWFLITFENSHWNRSWFIGRNFRTRKFGGDFFVRGNLRVGLLYGYGDDVPNVEGWTLAPMPTLEIGYRWVSVETTYMPFDGGVAIGIIKITF